MRITLKAYTRAGSMFLQRAMGSVDTIISSVINRVEGITEWNGSTNYYFLKIIFETNWV